MLANLKFTRLQNWFLGICLLLVCLVYQPYAYSLGFDTPIKTTRFSASSTTPTIIQGQVGAQTITLTNNGPDTATNVIASFRPVLTSGVTVSSVSAPGGACSFSSPNWNCPAIASVTNGSSFNITVNYSVTASTAIGLAIKQGEIRVNSNEYTECGGISEYRYSVWGRGGNTQENPATINSAFWAGNTQTATSAIPAGSFHSEPTSVVGAWPIAQSRPTGTYLNNAVAGSQNDVYQPSSTTAAPTVDKVITNLNGAAENTVSLPSVSDRQNNRRVWELQSCIYVPVATTVSPCANAVDDGAYVTVNGTTLWTQNSYTGGIKSQSTTLAPGYHIIKTRILNRNAATSTEMNPGGYSNLAGIVSGSVCSASSLDFLTNQAVPQNINIIAPTTLQLVKEWGTNSSINDSASIGATTGGTNNTALFSTAGGTVANSGTPVAIAVGNTITFPAETGINIGRYNTVLNCRANGGATANTLSGTNGQISNTLVIGAGDLSKAIVCTYTNTRKSATLTLRKTWAANSIANNTATVTNSGFINSASSGLSTATALGNTTTGTSITVYAGETGTISETFGVGSAANYNAVLSCTGATDTNLADGLTINAADTAIVCTYTNTRKSATLTLRKTWAANSIANNTATVTNSGFINSASSGLSTATALGNTTTGTSITVYAGETGTISETFGVGSAANYNAVLSCTGATDTNLADGLTINAADTAIVCTYTNTRKSATLTLRKTWAANSIANNTATVTNSGFINSASSGLSTATALGNTTTGTSITVYAGETGTISETFGVGSAANYNAVLSCTGATDTNLADGLTINAADTAIVCTYTNTRIAQNLTVVKQWTNATTGHTATVTTTGGTNNSTFNSTAPSTNTTGTTVTVYAGDIVTLPAETFGGGASASNYITTLACTGGSTLASGAVGQSVTISNSAAATTCTYTNTGLSDMVPSFTYMPNTGIVGSPYYGKFRCTNNGVAPASVGATCAITLPAGLSATCSPTIPTASTVAVNATINCTVTGTPTTATSSPLILTTGATNDSNGGTTNGGNNQVTQAITITEPTATAMCSSGSATNLLSAAGTEIYYENTTSSPTNNSFSLIASPATYVRTGSNFVVKGNWRWRNANPAFNSAAITYQLIVNGTVYAQLISAPSDQELGTLTALNGATLDGGLSTMQLYDFSVSGLAALPVSVTLPSTVTAISTLSMSFLGLALGDDAGLAPTVLNACALPKLTITKISNGDVGSFAFTGNNGFSNQTIPTVTSGVGVAGSTQTLTAVATATTIAETIPVGYTLTNVSCTGLGSGTAMPNLGAGNVVLSATAVVYGANIACTFTNTFSPAYTITGKVFLDNGKNAATPHNGLLEANEAGLGNITVQLTDCGSTVHQSTVTNGAGAYSLAIPNTLLAGTNVCVVEQPSGGLISVSGMAGNTGGAYSLALDRTQFTLSAATNYTGVDFGNVVESQLTGTGNQTIAAGTTASYGHQFISGTEGLVTFSTAQAPTPALTWASLVYVDTNCNALLDGGDTQVTAPIAVVAEQVVCLLQKVQSPSTAANGSQDVSTISASFAFTAPSAITRLYNQDDTTIIMDSGLVLVKKVRQVSSCPSTAGDTNPFVTNNQALPNALIEYQISYSNPSSSVVSNVKINDMTPSFTTFRSASCASTPSSVLCSISSAPSVGGVGAIQWNIANNPVGLTSGHSGDVRFCVRVDQ